MLMPLIPLSTGFTCALDRLHHLLCTIVIDNQLTHYPRLQANKQETRPRGPQRIQDPHATQAGSTNSPLLDAAQNVNLDKEVH